MNVSQVYDDDAEPLELEIKVKNGQSNSGRMTAPGFLPEAL